VNVGNNYNCPKVFRLTSVERKKTGTVIDEFLFLKQVKSYTVQNATYSNSDIGNGHNTAQMRGHTPWFFISPEVKKKKWSFFKVKKSEIPKMTGSINQKMLD